MRMRGIEPPRVLPHKNLNLARLPIPPHPRGWKVYETADRPARACQREFMLLQRFNRRQNLFRHQEVGSP